jgi:hypothetical protein
MESCNGNYSYMTTINVLLFSVPLCWGVYEVSKLTKLLRKYKTTLNNIEPKLVSLHKLIDDVSKEELTAYPFIQKINILINKSNRILH